MFRKDNNVRVVHAFLGKSPNGTAGFKDKQLVYWSIEWLEHLYAVVGTAVKSLIKEEIRDRHQQTLYADTYGRLLEQTTDQFTGNIVPL